MHIGGGQVIRHDALQEIEPVQRELGQDPPFLRDAGGQHVVERGDAVGGHEQQVLAIHLVNVADLPAGVKLQVGKVGMQENVGDLS